MSTREGVSHHLLCGFADFVSHRTSSTFPSKIVLRRAPDAKFHLLKFGEGKGGRFAAALFVSPKPTILPNMEFIPIKTRLIEPPQDDLFAVLTEAPMQLREHDIVVIASKVVAIAEGRCIPRSGEKGQKDTLVAKESDWYLPREAVPGEVVMHTITHGQLAVHAGVDPLGEYFVLWPEDPMRSAQLIEVWLKEKQQIKNLGVIVSDSKSTPLRRGVIGGAIGWSGVSPLFDNRARVDFFGHKSGGSQVNIADSVAAGAVLVMGEGNEQTPIVIARGVPYITEAYKARKDTHTSFVVAAEEDIFAPFLSNQHVPWQRGGRS